ncbi:MAG: response regulator [Flavobacterium sp.]|nr:MAG: response regulator [Flavobacterium sp.]
MKRPSVDILLIDDDAEDRNTFSDAINEIKIRTNLTMLEDGRNLIPYLESLKKLPEIIFLDLNMPFKSGVECLEEIRQHDWLHDLSVAIYSTSSTQKDVEDTFALGANVYIRKPTSFEKLKKVLNDVINMNFQFYNSGLNKDTFLLNI